MRKATTPNFGILVFETDICSEALTEAYTRIQRFYAGLK